MAVEDRVDDNRLSEAHGVAVEGRVDHNRHSVVRPKEEWRSKIESSRRRPPRPSQV